MHKTPTLLLLTGAAAFSLSACGSTDSNASDNTASTAAPAATATPSPASTGPISVDLSEWAVKPSATTASAGKIEFVATNTGKVLHEFVVIKTDKSADGLGTGKRVPEKGNVGETGDVKAGATKKTTIKLKPGHYALICNLPSHYKLGMHADFTVQ